MKDFRVAAVRMIVNTFAVWLFLAGVSLAQPYSWRNLLQGMVIENWSQEGDAWKIGRQGLLVGTARASDTAEWIWSNGSFADFNLRFVYSLPANETASVGIRVSPGSQPVTSRGYEILVGAPMGWYAAGSVREVQPSRPRPAEQTEGFHSCEISAVGDRITVSIDGFKKVDLHDRSFREGLIGFRTPGNGSIQIRELELQRMARFDLPSQTLQSAMDGAPGRFVSIMPGPHLEGWRLLWPDDGRWYLDDEVLVATDVRQNSWLFTEKAYRDFILQLEFRCDLKANGGVIYRYPWPSDTGERPGGPMARAAETQIIFNDVEQPGAMHGRMTVRKGISEPEKWNRYKLYCYDDRISVYINDSKVTDWHNSVAREGALGLQSLGESSTVYYRNIEIKEMPEAFRYPE